MTETVCNYAVLRFMPDRERGEFLNIGVALCAPSQAWFGYRLASDVGPRLARVFPAADRGAFERGLVLFREELDRIACLRTDREGLSEAFRELVRPREGRFHFGDIATVLGAEPEGSLEEAYRRRVA